MKKTSYSSLFPENSDKKSIAVLQSLVKKCEKEITAMQKTLKFNTLKLPAKAIKQLAEILIDFTLDIHSGSGIWLALEKYNTELFNTPLPLVHPVDTPLPSGVCLPRVKFLLWNIYPQLDEGLYISNKHIDLITASEAMTLFLNTLLPLLPPISPIKLFLDTPNDYGWEIKKKLIWLGTRSYLFRHRFVEYLKECNDSLNPVMLIDDFICQETTRYSGLGPIDILAECLSIPQMQKEELRSWYLRHYS
ncbi:MAG: DUF3843 family protein, partial [Thermoguttaceae bacterium]